MNAQAKHDDRGDDLYETCPEAVHALMHHCGDQIKGKGVIWEPACGPGAMMRVLQGYGLNVHGTDLIDYNTEDHHHPVEDFFGYTSAALGSNRIISNPPYMHQDNFVRHALNLVDDLWLLLRTNSVEGEGRDDILDCGRLVEQIIIKDRLPMMHRAGYIEAGGKEGRSNNSYSWFHWNNNYRGAWQTKRISWREAMVALMINEHHGYGLTTDKATLKQKFKIKSVARLEQYILTAIRDGKLSMETCVKTVEDFV